jgi:RsiW-degrading membrane proteinase PrsW (M82 family)
MEGLSYVAYTAFIVAALTEEGMKFIAFSFFFLEKQEFQ